MNQWSLYVDIEGFSPNYERGSQAMVSLGALTEAIYQVGSRSYSEPPQRIFAHQLGDGFVVVSDSCPTTLEQPITVAMILIRAVLDAGGAGKGAISEGRFADTLGMLPETVQSLYERSSGAPIPLGSGLMTILPVMGSALINSYRLLGSDDTLSGPLLILQRSDEKRLPSWVKTTATDTRIVVDWIHSSSACVDKITRAAGLPVSTPGSMEAQLRAYINKSHCPEAWRKNAERYLLTERVSKTKSGSVGSDGEGMGVPNLCAGGAPESGVESTSTVARPSNRKLEPRNLFIVGAGFTKSINPEAPLNDELLNAVVGADSNSSALGRAWERYKEPDIEKLLTRFDLDLAANREGWNDGDRREIEAQLAGYVKRFRFKGDSPWLVPFLEALQDNDVIVSLNYDCALEGFLDYHGAWSPRGGYCPIENPLDDELPENSRNIRIIKIHGSESFRRGPFGDRSDFMGVEVEINESLFPRSGESRHFGGGIESNPYVIAPSYVKRQAYELHHLMLDALRFAEQAKNLVVIGCSLRPEDGHLFLVLTKFLTGKWREKRIFIVDPQASEIGDRLERFISRAIFNEKNLVCLNGRLQDRLDELCELLS